MLLLMRTLLALIVLSACAKGGVEIVIDAQAPVTQVRLYIGVGDAMTEPIMPAQRGAPFPMSSAWPRDDYNELDVRDVVAGDKVTFQFQGNATLGAVIAVGFAGDKPVSASVVENIVVPSDIIARYELTLAPINDGTNGSPLELSIWQPPANAPKAGATCAALFDKSSGGAVAVVTDGDPDCDGWPTGDPKECQPNLYMSFRRPQLTEAACLVTERVVSTDGTVSDGCVIGGPPCRDGAGKETACTAPTPYCMPKSVCNRCSNLAGSSDWDCARNVARFPTQMPSHLHCKLFVDTQGALCQTTIQALGMPAADVAGHHCKTDNGAKVMATTVGAAWGESLTFADSVTGTMLQTDFKNLQSNCNFEIQISGHVEAAHLFGGIVAGALDNGRGIAVPIVFEINPTLYVGCDNQPPCQASWSFDVTELFDQCLNTPVFPP